MAERLSRAIEPRSRRLYVATTKTVYDKLAEISRDEKCTLSKTIHLLLLIGLDEIDNVIEFLHSEGDIVFR